MQPNLTTPDHLTPAEAKHCRKAFARSNTTNRICSLCGEPAEYLILHVIDERPGRTFFTCWACHNNGQRTMRLNALAARLDAKERHLDPPQPHDTQEELLYMTKGGTR